jgi:aryl-alcohol dehydrogenase-like predicted oxidoreductase
MKVATTRKICGVLMIAIVLTSLTAAHAQQDQRVQISYLTVDSKEAHASIEAGMTAAKAEIKRDVETSLRRLRRDHIELHLLFESDARVPVQETIRALDDLVTQ